MTFSYLSHATPPFPRKWKPSTMFKMDSRVGPEHGHREDGFTLIELAIVLVVIGLIVGGVMVGRDLIRNAEIRSDISTVEMLNTSLNTFKLKYHCLPGDCANATSFFGASTEPDLTFNGDGNGLIDRGGGSTATCIGAGNTPTWSGSSDSMAVMEHLSLAGLISNRTYNASFPGGEGWVLGGSIYPTKYWGRSDRGRRSGIALYSCNGQTWWKFGISPRSDGSLRSEDVWYAEEAWAFDSKMDDGLPATGMVVATRLADFPNYLLQPVASSGTAWFQLGGVTSDGRFYETIATFAATGGLSGNSNSHVGIKVRANN